MESENKRHEIIVKLIYKRGEPTQEGSTTVGTDDGSSERRRERARSMGVRTSIVAVYLLIKNNNNK